MDNLGFASFRIEDLGTANAGLMHLVNGSWRDSERSAMLIDPLNGGDLLRYPDTQESELPTFVDSLKSCPKSGLHNPFGNVGRYLMLGQVCFRAASLLSQEEVADYFTKLIMRVCPKSYAQARAEVTVVIQFLKNFSGDQVRFLATGYTTPGDRDGQRPHDYRIPFGSVVIVAPFNFSLEIPALQLLGALFMGNRPLIKSATTVSAVIEQFVRLLIYCGLPAEDVDLIHCRGSIMDKLIRMAAKDIRLLQFTGSSEAAESLALAVHGKIRVEDAGFDWTIYGPDYDPYWLEYSARQRDLDTFAFFGQKCSAQSIQFTSMPWWESGLIKRQKELAAQRKLADLTIGPVLTFTTDQMLGHVEQLMQLPGSEVLFGGHPLTGHNIPEVYGAIEPTAVFVDLETMMASDENFRLVTTEIFGPVTVITLYAEGQLGLVLEACERMTNHLTAAVVSNDPIFNNRVLKATVNGTIYTGMRARTTGAPQNHRFGPGNDPRGAGIGDPKSIVETWSGARCVIEDFGPIDPEKDLPKQS